jgi:hypothetical protein
VPTRARESRARSTFTVRRHRTGRRSSTLLVALLHACGGFEATILALAASPPPSRWNRLVIMMIPRAAVLDACRRHPAITLGAIRTLAHRVQAFAGPIATLALRHVTAGVARFLLDEAHRAATDEVPPPGRVRTSGRAGERCARSRRPRSPGSRPPVSSSARTAAPSCATLPDSPDSRTVGGSHPRERGVAVSDRR